MLIPGPNIHKQRGILGAIIGAGAVLGSAFLAGKGAKDRNQAQIAEARRAEAFQERMSNTAHQREIDDLRSAGLNPILSGTGGRGASSPGGAQAQIQDELTPAVSSALQASRLTADIKSVMADIKNKKETNRLIKTQSEKTTREGALLSQKYNESQALTNIHRITAQLLKTTVSAANLDRDIAQGQYGPFMRWLKQLIPALGPAGRLSK